MAVETKIDEYELINNKIFKGSVVLHAGPLNSIRTGHGRCVNVKSKNGD